MNPLTQPAPEEAPLYIRWSPDRSVYAIELKLGLVSRISAELAEVEKLGIEVGGVLIGSFPSANTPTLRIEDFEMIPRRPEDGAVYMLDPDQHERFAQVRWAAKSAGRAVIGFFRSHSRPGPLKPSLADRSLLAGQFSQATYAVLLIQAGDPRMAAFFIAANGQLPEDSSVKEFRFDEKAFLSLPEIPHDAAVEQAPPRARAARYVLGAVLVLILLIAGVLFWPRAKSASSPGGAGTPSNDFGLAVTASDRLLKISWNQSAQEISAATDATLVIRDGPSRREIKLGPDELKQGIVEYERNSQQVEMTMTLNTPGSTSPSQSIAWPAK